MVKEGGELMPVSLVGVASRLSCRCCWWVLPEPPWRPGVTKSLRKVTSSGVAGVDPVVLLWPCLFKSCHGTPRRSKQWRAKVGWTVANALATMVVGCFLAGGCARPGITNEEVRTWFLKERKERQKDRQTNRNTEERMRGLAKEIYAQKKLIWWSICPHG